MNSYPPELLTQLAPIMFVAGLDPANVVHSPINSPSTPTPQSATTPTQASKDQDQFAQLIHRLRDALSSQRKVAVWQPEKSNTFQIVLVDKDTQFPPRKVPVNFSEDGASPGLLAHGGQVMHSPLSPLTPTSPLCPDGLIAPIWIRKHTTLVPSVFVLFLRIYEYPLSTPKSPLEPMEIEREREREAEERRRDTELAAEVAMKKRSTNERGIKLTVVLIASRKLLDDSALDARLTYIRRQSGLDSRAALFVLSPVSSAELGEFVRSLQSALYESALEYYMSHSKRVRRKRNRHSQSTAYMVPPSPLASTNIARPLRPEGWSVRYEYKMACFAEFRGEDEVALKHYQDAYSMLLIMFGSTAILPPRTKRWAEAKVLADCISVKVTKLYLYNNEHTLALAQHNIHMRKFSDFSRGWGIGEETFEYWSWMARQYRVLAELLELGLRSTLVIPVHKSLPINPNALISAIQPPSQRPTNPQEQEFLRSSGSNPSHALQHPGFYYYMAARCIEMRKARFLAAMEAEAFGNVVNSSPGFANEKKVDHNVIVLEQYTKAYELFKKYSPADPKNPMHGRLALWIAYRIAQTYYDSGKFDMAVKFFERIARTYRREQWDQMLQPLLLTWYACAKQLGDVELGIRLLIELLGHDDPEVEDASALEEDFIAVLKSTVPSKPDTPLRIELSEARPILSSSISFWLSEVKVGEPCAFQLILEAPKSVTISSLPIESIAIYPSEAEPPLVVYHSGEAVPEDTQARTRRVDVGEVLLGGQTKEQDGSTGPRLEAYLRWNPGESVVFSGTMIASTTKPLKVQKFVVTISEGPWKIEVPYDVRSGKSQKQVSRWLCSMDPPKFIVLERYNATSASVRHRQHQVHVAVAQQAPAYLNEDYLVVLEITNGDDQALDISLDVLLQPTEIDGAINSISIDEQRSSSLIRGIRCGKLMPGVSVLKTLHLLNTGAGGDRVIDISVRSRPGRHEAEEDGQSDGEDEREDNYRHLDITETERTFVVPTIDPLKVTQDVVYRYSTQAWTGISGLRNYDADFWDGSKGSEAQINTKIEFAGPWDVEILRMEAQKEDNDFAKVIDSSIDLHDAEMWPAEFAMGDTLSEFCRVALAPPEADILEQGPQSVPGPGQIVVTWRRIMGNGGSGTESTSIIALPPLRPPTETLVALLDMPPVGKLHVPFQITLQVRNYHPTRSANIVVSMESEPSIDSFIVSGLRSGRLPIMLPGTEERLLWTLVPMETGYHKIPEIKVLDARSDIQPNPMMSKGQTGGIMGGQQQQQQQPVQPVVAEETKKEVRIVDVRIDARKEAEAKGGLGIVERQEAEERMAKVGGMILVLP